MPAILIENMIKKIHIPITTWNHTCKDFLQYIIDTYSPKITRFQISTQSTNMYVASRIHRDMQIEVPFQIKSNVVAFTIPASELNENVVL